MLRFLERISDKLSFLREYFNGKWYVATVCAMVLLGHLAALDFYTIILGALLFTVALLTCDTARPAIPFVLTFVYQLSVKNSPGFPSFSSYFFRGWRIALIVVFGVILLAGLVCFVLRTRMFSHLRFKDAYLLIPLLVLSAGFVLNGAFSPEWSASSLLFGVLQAVAYTMLYLFFLCGLRGEDTDELTDYFITVSAFSAVLLILQVAGVYLTSDSIIADGSVVKESIVFGWGIWNTAGVCLAVLIPMCFLGAYRAKKPYAYLALAAITFGAAVLTLSRNALLFGGIAFAVCIIICCFGRKNRRVFVCVTVAGVLLVIGGLFLFRERIAVILSDFLERGFSDNGRYVLWETGINNFLSSPIFGVGFFAFVSDTFETVTFMPDMAHQTIVQLLSCMGIVGLASYGFYRFKTLTLFLKRPSVEKLLLLCSVLVLLFESLLDNFVFYFLPLFHYTLSLVIAEKSLRDANLEKAPDRVE